MSAAMKNASAARLALSDPCEGSARLAATRLGPQRGKQRFRFRVHACGTALRIATVTLPA